MHWLKYISPDAEKIQYLHNIFSERDEIYLVFTEKSKFSFILYSTENYRKHKLTLNFFPGRFSFDLISSVYLSGITLGLHKGCI